MLDKVYLNSIKIERELRKEVQKGNILNIQEKNRNTYNEKRKRDNTYKFGDLVAILEQARN